MSGIERECADCGATITVSVSADGTYDGGHYFGIDLPDGSEYWECVECYNDTDK